MHLRVKEKLILFRNKISDLSKDQEKLFKNYNILLTNYKKLHTKCSIEKKDCSDDSSKKIVIKAHEL